MKKLFLIGITLVCLSCKKDTKTSIKQLTTTEKIANAHGVSNWDKVTLIEFTFNVDKDSSHFERSWVWKPKTNDVTLITNKDTISYNRKNIDSLSLAADQGFINDKFWLLAPFQLVWDKETIILDSINKTAPISKKQANKLTTIYSNQGGYTPGDAYDFYYNNSNLITEWVFRQGNTKKPTMITTFENYEDFNGIKIAKDHKKPNENWNLYFTGILIKTE